MDVCSVVDICHYLSVCTSLIHSRFFVESLLVTYYPGKCNGEASVTICPDMTFNNLKELLRRRCCCVQRKVNGRGLYRTVTRVFNLFLILLVLASHG